MHAWLGVNLAGAADVPLNPAYRGASLAHAINLGRARLMIAAASFLPRIAEAAADLPALETVIMLGDGDAPELGGPRVMPLATAAAGPLPDGTVLAGDGVSYRDTVSVLFTSGTNGPAKGVIMTHDYLAVTGLLGAVGPAGGDPVPPLNLVADLAGGGMLAASGICAALVERDRSGHGQRIGAVMTDGVLSMMEMWLNAWRTPLLPERGLGFTAGAAPFYRCYRCADGQYVAVGAVEDAFFRA